MKKVSKFIAAESRFLKVLNEQAEEEGLPPDAAMPPPEGSEAAEQAEAQPNPEPQPAAPAAPAAQALSPEGEVTLIRLLKQAFIAKPSDADAMSVENLGDVTSQNAKAQLKQISAMLSNYVDVKI